jgi:hypothetical protein
MTCFWTGLCVALKRLRLLDERASEAELIRFLKANNGLTPEVRWVGPDGPQQLTRLELEANYAHVRDWDASTAQDGYLCGACDAYLMLVCDLFQHDIMHEYAGHRFEYRAARPTGLLFFGSTTGHFYAK